MTATLRASIPALLLSLAALSAGCDTRGLCAQSADHLRECLGEDAVATAECTPELAENVLEQSCEELQQSQAEGKSDFFDFLCEVFGIFCPAYEPCADKVCGDACTLCDPNDPDCFESQELKVCDGSGACVSTNPSCD